MSGTSPVAVAAAACTGCGVCVQSCPTDVLRMGDAGTAVVRHPEDCQFCFLCVFDCAWQAIAITIPPVPDSPRWWSHWSRGGSPDADGSRRARAAPPPPSPDRAAADPVRG